MYLIEEMKGEGDGELYRWNQEDKMSFKCANERRKEEEEGGGGEVHTREKNGRHGKTSKQIFLTTGPKDPRPKTQDQRLKTRDQRPEITILPMYMLHFHGTSNICRLFSRRRVAGDT